MMDLRIVIVSWNNRDTLPRLLSSLEKACEGLAWNAVVVDNASTDGTKEWLSETEIPNNGSRITNNVNKGFARACNQGLTGSNARYVLLLNPDCECPEGSLVRFVHEADKYPEAGILGPKLVNEDGSVQTSLRRYPSWIDQMGVLFKLHNFFPNASIFRRYFAKDRDLNVEQSVEQVMGACFLIRREVIDRLGGLDERYFAWFEEVDYCKMAKEAGWEIRYLPSVEVRHIGGHSFAQASSVKKQRIFNASMISYFQKWHPGLQAQSLAVCSSLSIGLAWLADKLGLAGKGSREVLKRGAGRRAQGAGKEGFSDLRSTIYDLRPWFLLIFSVELISGLTIFNNTWNTLAVIVASLAMIAVAFKKPSLGLAVLLLELVIGSKGALLQLGGWPGTSLRICLFASFFIGWIGNFIQAKSWGVLIDSIKARWEWIGLALILVYAALRGLALNQEFFLKDANAWIFLLLLIPVFDFAKRKGSELIRFGSMALIAGIIWIGIKTLLLEYFFGHAFHISPEVYLWVRRTGVGEVTLVIANAFRLFFQSHVYEMVGVLGSVSFLLGKGARGEGRGARPYTRVAYFVLISSIVSLLVSLSRSIWMGTTAGLLVLGLCYFKDLLKQWKEIFKIISAGIVSLVLIFGAIAFPIPKVDYANLKDVFGSRVSTGDPASASRWNLLKAVETKIKEAPLLGSGFGASITYDSKDPRVLKDHPDGKYTTYAFEWGWFEHWIKFGLFGFLFMIFLVFRIGLRAWRSNNEDWLRYSMVATLVGLSVVHIFTPYLNHPLGFGILMMIEGMGLVSGRRAAVDHR